MNDLPELTALLTQAAAAVEAGRVEEALETCRRALELAPTNARLRHNVGVLLSRCGELPGALPHLLESLQSLGMFEEADQAFLRFEAGAAPSACLAATGLRWARTSVHGELEAKFLQMVVNWKYEAPDLPWLAEVIGSMQYFDFSRDDIARLYRSYNSLMQQMAGTASAIDGQYAPNDDRARLGYLSSDFRRHVMGDIMLDVFGCHDRDRFEVFAYSLLPEALEDAWTARFRSGCDGFVSLAALDDIAAAARIAEDGLNVLVDLTSHTPQARPGILLRKPARLIVAHLGDHGTIGLEQVDFKITDMVADLPGAADFQIERPFVMHGCVMPFRRVAPAPADPAGRARLGVSADAFIFGAFASTLKLSPRVLGLWRRILDAVPKSCLALSPFTKATLIGSINRLKVAGIPEDRIVVIQPSADEAVNRARYRYIDAMLDTLPYTGGDSTVAALDMGVPVVTRAGQRQAERMGLSILTHLDVTDTVAGSDDDYVAIARRLATDSAWRLALSARILERIEATGIADFKRYTRALEDAFQRMIAIKRSESR